MKEKISRLNQISKELGGLCVELQVLAAKAVPLLQELDDMDVPLQPEVQAMFRAVLNNAPKPSTSIN
jgi:hypothetical protein